jgi:Flp pilus assembly protein TadB
MRDGLYLLLTALAVIVWMAACAVFGLPAWMYAVAVIFIAFGGSAWSVRRAQRNRVAASPTATTGPSGRS